MMLYIFFCNYINVNRKFFLTFRVTNKTNRCSFRLNLPSGQFFSV